MGTTPANFHISGNFPVERDNLKSVANGRAMLLAVAFSMWADIQSGPLALLMSSLLMREKTSSGVTLKPS